MRFPFENWRSHPVAQPYLPRHTITPPQGAHLIAFEWCTEHANQPLTVGWLLTDEEREAGKQGIVWPDEI
jgi:hypothetical protein